MANVTHFPARMADCHPERPHWAKGLCDECYRRQPEDIARRKASNARWFKERGGHKTTFYRHLKSLYGITGEDYERMLVEQDGKCAICCEPPASSRLNVDHCHRTGKVRGLLCKRCNTQLAAIESPRLQAYFTYLEQHGTPVEAAA